jgi:hypothetical protein
VTIWKGVILLIRARNKPLIDRPQMPSSALGKSMRVKIQGSMLKPANPCPVCGGETALAEIEPHPLHFNFEIHGYLCDRCGPIKSLVVLRSWRSNQPKRVPPEFSRALN